MTLVLRWLADEDFDADILRGVLRQLPTLDVVRVQDVELSGHHDREVLAWAAQEDRVLLTHDVSTMKTYAYERSAAGLAMPGVFVVSQALAIGRLLRRLSLSPSVV